MPGQTRRPHRRRRAGRRPSMEGRAIARPNDILVIASEHKVKPSMEGRAIARPNMKWKCVCANTVAFNGGPGNCPAKPSGG